MGVSRRLRALVIVLAAVIMSWTGLTLGNVGYTSGDLTGTFLANDAEPVPWAQVRAVADNGSQSHAWLDPMGNFGFYGGLPIGHYWIEGVYENRVVARKQVTVEAVNNPPVALSFAAGTIRVHVNRDGANDQGATVMLVEAAPTAGCGTSACTTDPMKDDAGSLSSCQCTSPEGRKYFCDPSGCRWMDGMGFQVPPTDANGNTQKLVPVGTYAGSVQSSNPTMMPSTGPYPDGGTGAGDGGTTIGTGWQHGSIHVATIAATTVGAAANVDAGTFEYATGILQGHITAGGEPVLNAQVRAEVMGLGSIQTSTDGNGGYSLRLPTSPTYNVVASTMMTMIASQPGVVVAPESPVTLDFNEPGGFLTGIVTRDGLPVGGAMIWARQQMPAEVSCATAAKCDYVQGDFCKCEYEGRRFFCDPMMGCEWEDGGRASFSTNADGTFRQLVSPGRYDLAVSSAPEHGYMPGPGMPTGDGGTGDAGATYWNQYGSVVVKRLTSIDVVDMETKSIGAVDYATGIVEATFTGCGSEPLRGAQLQVSTPSGHITSHYESVAGTYRLRAPAGDYTVGGNWQNFPIGGSSPITVTAGSTVYHSGSLRLGQLRTLILQDGQPAQNAEVLVVERAPTCAQATSCRYIDPMNGFCDCEKDGRQYHCDPSGVCRWMNGYQTGGTTGTDGYVTVTAPPGDYLVSAFSAKTMPPPGPMPGTDGGDSDGSYSGAYYGGGGGILIASVPATVVACTMNEVNVQPAVAVAPSDAPVTVPVGDGLTLGFTEINEAGSVSVVTTTEPPPGDAPIFSAVGYYYDIVVPAHTGPVKLCFGYDVEVTEPETLRVFHQVNGAWIDITVLPVDTANRLVCGLTESFSFFALGRPTQSTVTARITAPESVPAAGKCRATVTVSGSGAPAGAVYRWTIGEKHFEGATITPELRLGANTIALDIVAGKSVVATTHATVRVVDTVPPTLAMSVSPSSISPPTDKLVKIKSTPTAKDNCGEPTVTIVGVHSVGGTPEDWAFSDGSLDLRVRATKGRTYTIEYAATDGSGNRTTATATVVVPNDGR